MSIFDVGFVVLFVGVVGYLFRHRLPRLRRYLRIVIVLGVLLILIGSYVDRQSLIDGFREGRDLAET